MAATSHIDPKDRSRFAGPRQSMSAPRARLPSDYPLCSLNPFPSLLTKFFFGDPTACSSLAHVSGLAEIQEAIEKLAPEERARLLDWLESFDSDLEAEWTKEANQRFEELLSGKEQSVDAFDAINEIRREIR